MIREKFNCKKKTLDNLKTVCENKKEIYIYSKILNIFILDYRLFWENYVVQDDDI